LAVPRIYTALHERGKRTTDNSLATNYSRDYEKIIKFLFKTKLDFYVIMHVLHVVACCKSFPTR